MGILFVILAFFLGAALGSFACCQAWRIRLGDRSKWSHCLECKKRLPWYDNIPVVSWLLLRGKCRNCGAKIGVWEIFSEIFLGLLFAGFAWWFWERWSDGTWGAAGELVGIQAVIYWLMVICFAVLLVAWFVVFIYDARWKEMPTKVLTFCVICAIMWVILKQWSLFASGQFSWEELLNLGGAIVILPVMYYFLYKVGKEKWVGGGDWLLALSLALVLGNFWLAFGVLFVANLLGSLVGIFLLIRSGLRKGRGMKMAFGPFLIIGFLVVFAMQDLILQWTAW